MATIKDVAKMAGVSTTTVSHVINKTRFVAEATTEKVWEAINTLNYAPSAVARSLKCNTTRTIGMLVTQSYNTFFSEVVHGVEHYCYKHGYTLVLCNTEGSISKQRDYLRMLAEKRVDGLIVMCSDLSDELWHTLDRMVELPMVVMDWGPETPHSDKIIDNVEQGAYLAVRHLIEQGHEKIGCITGQMDKLTCRERLRGMQKALTEADLPLVDKWVLESDFECAKTVDAVQQIIDMPESERPTALFAFNDIMALAAMSRFHQNGIRVPDDISIIGYDNIELAAYFSPPLTTIHQPKRRLGKTAVELLFKRMKDKEHEIRTFAMAPELIERQSVKALNK
ncbi:HTH-type transcriptional repressor PurR [Vibrio stylophorae]|uniref:HTH-type transcriptional repressor PurR n=1 Tax=Vibrio stylophorae TaxID=659351 RepID=A0ABM8ZRX8_9VIBR|nr:substrate-binding domain-containing protein [Vibrio stylophorae]CAH0533049.1 HTH-type transcriptional repressor PurR [Vibrio stylophorae]